jgi:hypothetical protein
MTTTLGPFGRAATRLATHLGRFNDDMKMTRHAARAAASLGPNRVILLKYRRNRTLFLAPGFLTRMVHPRDGENDGSSIERGDFGAVGRLRSAREDGAPAES